MTQQVVALALAGALFAALGQVCFKWGSDGRQGILEFFNPAILMGLLLYMAGTLFWIRALAAVPLTVLYPFAALTYVLVNVLAVVFLGEQMTIRVVAGTCLVLLGLLLVVS